MKLKKLTTSLNLFTPIASKKGNNVKFKKMKKFIILGAFILTAGLLSAQTQANQNKRIKQGVQSGELTKKETKQLRRQQRDIRRTKKAAKADGKVTKKEKAIINSKQKAASRNIRRKKNNERDRK